MSEIDDLRALHEATTPGPWTVDARVEDDVVLWGKGADPDERYIGGLNGKLADARFIVAVHEALPGLLDELAKLRHLRNAVAEADRVATTNDTVTRQDLEFALTALSVAFDSVRADYEAAMREVKT